MNLDKFYREILQAGYLTADKEGRISGQVGSIPPTPVTIEGKRMVLPTMENMQLLDKSGIVIFHPLQEDSLKGESAVLVKFRSMINLRINYVIGGLMESLLRVITSPAMHKKLSPIQSEILTKVDKADAAVDGKNSEVMTQFSSLLKAIDLGNKDKYFVYICLTKGGSANGVSYNRFASVTSPFLEELNKGEKKVFGVTLSDKTKAAINQLLEYILPGLNVPGTYNRGSSADIAPFTVALLKALLGLAEKTNQVAQNFSEFISKLEEIEYVGEWPSVYEDLMFLQNEIRMIPMQAGNNTATLSGPTVIPRAAQVQAPVQLTPQMVPQQMQAAVPYQQQVAMAQQPVQTAAAFTTADGQFDFAAMMKANQPQQMMMPQPGMLMPGMMPPMMQAPVGMMTVMTPQGPMLVPQQAQPMMMQPQPMVMLPNGVMVPQQQMQPAIPRFAQAAIQNHNANMQATQAQTMQQMYNNGYGMAMPGYGKPPGAF